MISPLSTTRLVLAAVACIFFANGLSAQTWNTDSAGMWTNGPNWTSSTVPNGVDSVAVFGNILTAARNVTNDVAITNGTIVLDATNTYRLISASGGRIYFDVSSGSAFLIASNTAGSAAKSLLVPFTMLDALTISNMMPTNVFTIGGTGNIITNGGNTLTVGGPGFVTISNQITGAGGLTKIDSGTLLLARTTNTYSGGTLISGGTLMGNSRAFEGAITNNANLLYFNAAASTNYATVVGTGNLIVSNTAGIGTVFISNLTYSGETRVQSGVMFLTNSLSTITNSSGIRLEKGGTLHLVNAGITNSDRIKDTASLTLNGGTFVLREGSETIGAITNLGGSSTINTTNSTLTATALVRGDRTTIHFIGNGSNVLTTTPTLNNGILPYATVDGVDFATHDGNGTGIRRYTNYVTTFSATAANNVISTGAVQTINASITNNSLVLGTNLVIDTGNTLRLESGGLLLTRAGMTLTNGTLSFGDSEGIIINNNNTTIYTTLAGTNGLTKSGTGTLFLEGANALTGKLTINDGTLVMTNNGTLNLNSGITIDLGGKLQLAGGSLSATTITATNGAFQFLHGTLTISAGSIFGTNDDIRIGNIAGTTSTINFTGGTNIFGVIPGSDRLYFGKVADATNFANVVGNDTVLSNTVSIFVGDSGYGFMVVSNGAKVYAASGTSIIGNNATASNSLLLVSGNGSQFNAFNLSTGDDGVNCQLIVSNSGLVTTSNSFRIGQTSGDGNKAIVTDAGSHVISYGMVTLTGGDQNLLMITNSGRVTLATTSNLVVGQSGTSNRVVVAGSGSIFSNAAGQIVVGNGSAFNRMEIVNGGLSFTANTNLVGSGGNSNLFLVTDSGSLARMRDLYIGNSGSYNEMLITNGGQVLVSGNTYISEGLSSTGNILKIESAGSVFQSTGIIYVGSNANTEGTGAILITNQGTLQVGGLVSGFDNSGIISNRGGIYQFTNSTPTITTNSVDSIILTNGIVSFKGATEADISTSSIAQITYQGENSFQLNNSTGSLFSAYTFGTNNSASFQHLIMVDGGTRWQATNTTLNTGGIMTFSNTTATLFGTTTNNAGTMRVSATNGASTSITFEKSLVISGTGNGSGAIQNLMATNTLTAPMTLAGNSTISSASGKLTVLGAITNGGNTLTLGGAGNVTMAAQISGTGGLTMNGGGTVTLSNSSVNTFTGATAISNTTVRLSTAGALNATSGVTLSATGTLLLDGGAIDRIGNTVGITMDGGALTQNDKAETMGTLTLKSNSTITLNYNGTVADLTFDNGSYTAGTLTIVGWNWNGTTGADDRVFFTNDPGVTFLSNITFQGFQPGATRLGTGEIIPSIIPEPGTVTGGILVMTLMAARGFRSRFRGKSCIHS